MGDRSLILLDTCAYLFAAHEPDRLSSRARRVLVNPETVLVWSPISTWELGIKARKGRLDFPSGALRTLEEGLARLNVRVLPVTQAHALRCNDLPALHSDPFDRMLIAQALEENLTLLTSDEIIPTYPGVKTLW